MARKPGKKTVLRVLYNWRGMLSKKHMPKHYAEAYFLGAWSALSDNDAAMLIANLTKHEYKIIMDYPMWS